MFRAALLAAALASVRGYDIWAEDPVPADTVVQEWLERHTYAAAGPEQVRRRTVHSRPPPPPADVRIPLPAPRASLSLHRCAVHHQLCERARARATAALSRHPLTSTAAAAFLSPPQGATYDQMTISWVTSNMTAGSNCEYGLSPTVRRRGGAAAPPACVRARSPFHLAHRCHSPRTGPDRH